MIANKTTLVACSTRHTAVEREGTYSSYRNEQATQARKPPILALLFVVGSTPPTPLPQQSRPPPPPTRTPHCCLRNGA